MGPIPAKVIAMPDALFNRVVKNEFNANANDELLSPYPKAENVIKRNMSLPLVQTDSNNNMSLYTPFNCIL